MEVKEGGKGDKQGAGFAVPPPLPETKNDTLRRYPEVSFPAGPLALVPLPCSLISLQHTTSP